MKKYYIGFIVLAVLTLGLTGYVLKLGSDAKSDKKIETAAEDIAQKLNSYVREKDKVPDNLNEVGAGTVPSEIRYTKNSEKSYTYCVTYKAARSYGGSIGVSSLISGAVSSSFSSAYKTDSSYKPTELYLNYMHQKGENCQTVEPVISMQESSSSDSTQSLIDEYCNPSAQYYEYYKSYCQDLPKSTVN